MEVSGQLHVSATKKPSGNHWIGGWVVPRVAIPHSYLNFVTDNKGRAIAEAVSR
jgi:hypothetical protein